MVKNNPIQYTGKVLDQRNTLTRSIYNHLIHLSNSENESFYPCLQSITPTSIIYPMS
jgi:hypothetical protein